MTGRSPVRRVTAAAVATTLVGMFSFVGPLGTAAAAAPGPYSGYAHSSAIHLDAVTNATNRLLNVDAAVVNAAVDSAGVKQRLTAHQRPVVNSTMLGKKSYGSSRLLDVGVAKPADGDGQVQLDLPSGQTMMGAPGGGDPMKVALLDAQKIATAANATVLKRTAGAQWNADTCVLGEPISMGTFEAARLELIDRSANESTTDFDQELVGIAANADGPERDAVNTVSLTQLYDGAGDGFGLLAATMATIAPVTLFEGTDDELTIELLGNALLRAQADGSTGGAKITFEAPAVSVIQDNVRTTYVPNDTLDVIEIPTADGGALALRIGQLDVKQTASNGTSAKASGAVVTLDVLRGQPAGFDGGTLAIGHVEAAVNVPVGGILCPLRVEVEATPPAVAVGKTVDVTTTVYNDFECPIVNVRVVDTLTAVDDARFTITSAPGAVRKSSGTGLRTGFIEWLIPRIEAHGSATRTFTLRMDSGAGKVNISGVASGALLNCPASPGADDASVSGIGRTNASVRGSSTVRVPVSKVLGGGVRPPARPLPATGVASTAMAGLGLLTTAGGLALSLRRRRSS